MQANFVLRRFRVGGVYTDHNNVCASKMHFFS